MSNLDQIKTIFIIFNGFCLTNYVKHDEMLQICLGFCGKKRKRSNCKHFILFYCDAIFTFHMKNILINKTFKLSSFNLSILHI